ncbi:MAG: phosphatidate cytidylyltransferase, partial [Clostridiaceae bacterium]|nr:phosphatidate cytidylyltransferase [Clostridiaceae bacterium]
MTEDLQLQTESGPDNEAPTPSVSDTRPVRERRPENRKMQNRQRVITAFIFAGAVIVVMLPSIWLNWLPLLMFAFVSVVAGQELYAVTKLRFPRLNMGMSMPWRFLFLVPLFIALSYPETARWYSLWSCPDAFNPSWYQQAVWLTGLSLGLVLIAALLYYMVSTVVWMIIRGPGVLPDAIAAASAGLYVGLPMAIGTIFLFAVPNGFLWLVFALVMPWLTDIAAYYSGHFFGRRHILPGISRNKTLAGVIGGLIGGVLTGALFMLLLMRGEAPCRPGAGTNLLCGALFGLITSLMAQFGDWFASG